MDEVSKLFERYCNAMQKNYKVAQFGVYSVALIGLTIAIRRVRPISRFAKPSDIPNLFIRQRRLLNGYVERIEPNGALLMVKHKPPIPVPALGQKYLPVKISGVNVTSHGISWLQSVVVGNEIKFIPVSKDRDSVHCEVLIEQVTPKKKIRTINVGASLVEVGFGKMDQLQLDRKTQLIYMRTLRAAEERALRKEMGLKYYIKPTMIILTSMITRIANLPDWIRQQRRVPKVPKVAVS